MILSGARDRDWTGGLFLTKEALYLWATWAWTVILTVYYRLIKKTEKDKLFEHLLCIRNQKDDVYLKMEPATGFEPVTCWLQISCSTNWATPALYFSFTQPLTMLRLDNTIWSGKRGSNSQPTAWKAVALPIELFPHIFQTALYADFLWNL